jgi:ribonuclease HI
MYYSIRNGRDIGIFTDWNEVNKLVKGFKGAVFKKFKTLKDAEDFLYNYQETDNKKVKLKNCFNNSISVDGACSGNPGIGEYKCVDTITKQLIFKSKKYSYVTNNVMEFLALVDGLKYLKSKKNTKNIKIIYTDSITAISWVNKKQINTNLPPNNPVFFEIKKSIQWLKNNNISSIEIKKWNTKKYGEIPADFNRK